MAEIDPVKSNQNPSDKDIKFSPKNKEDLRELFYTHARQFKDGELIAIFKDGHWQAVRPEQNLVGKIETFKNIVIRDELDKQEGDSASTIFSKAVEYIFSGKDWDTISNR